MRDLLQDDPLVLGAHQGSKARLDRLPALLRRERSLKVVRFVGRGSIVWQLVVEEIRSRSQQSKKHGPSVKSLHVPGIWTWRLPTLTSSLSGLPSIDCVWVLPGPATTVTHLSTITFG